MRDIRNLDLNLLKALDALLDERNVTWAAARLGVTQPALSGMLTRLRQNFDDPLFVRAQRGIIPTQRALDLAPPLKQVLSEISSLLAPVGFDPAKADLTFTIAATDYALRAIAVPFLSALKPLAPKVRVALAPVDRTRLPEQMERGEIDLALLTPDSTPPDLHARRLFDEHYVGLVRSDHPALTANASIILDGFCALDYALVSYSGSCFHGVTDDALAQLGRTRRVTLSVQSFMVLPDILRSCDMAAVVPARLAADQPGLQTFDPPFPIPGFTKIAAWHERTHRAPAHRWLRDLLFSTCSYKPDSADQG